MRDLLLFRPKWGKRFLAAVLVLSSATLLVLFVRMRSNWVQAKAVQEAMEHARQQRHVTYRRISDCLVQEEAESRHNETSSNFAFLCTLPTLDANWTVESRPLNTNPYSISTLVPGLPSDVTNNLPTLLQSIFLQTRLAEELILVISNVQNITDFSYETGKKWCQQTHQTLVQQQHTNNQATITIKLICIGERLSAGRARNVAAHIASSQILSFIDADDTELPHRNYIIQNMFQCHQPHLRVFLHSYIRNRDVSKHTYDVQRRKRGDKSEHGYIPEGEQCADQEDTNMVEVLGYDGLQDILDTTQQRLWLNDDVAHGHIVVHRSVMKEHHYRFNSMAYGEDSVFCRDVLYAYGRQPKAVVFLNRPLTTYYEVGHRGEELFEPAAGS